MSVIDIEYLIECVECDDLIGFCVKCGNDQYGCEPDARKYECESCGEHAVYGAQELLLMGYAG